MHQHASAQKGLQAATPQHVLRFVLGVRHKGGSSLKGKMFWIFKNAFKK